MATVGLSFGSATSGDGFDVASTVTSILAIQQAIETPWKTQLTDLAAQDTALSALGTDLSTLSTALESLTNFDGLFMSKQGSSSDTDVLELTTANMSAVSGSHTVVVNSLAQTSSWYSDSITDSSDTLGGSLTLQVGSGDGTTITVDSTDTLATLAAKINSGSYGVTASVVTSTTGSRLSLVSSTSGAAGEISLTTDLTDATKNTSVGFTEGQTGKDASLTVDGLETTSASNTVTGAIAGVTFQLLAADPDTSIQVQITNDNSSIETAAQSFVTAYNAIISAIKTQEGNDSSGAAEPLYGDPTLAQIQSQLSAALFSGTASGSISNLEQLGFTVGQDGTLSLDSSTLDAALNSNFSDVEGFFQNADSFGLNLSKTLDNLGSSTTTGLITLALSQNKAEETTLNANVTAEDARIAAEKTSLTAELNTANEILQSIPAQLKEIDQIYSAITGYNQSS